MNSEIRRKLRRITDILWAGGVTNPVTYIEQLSYLIYLKLLDEEESSRLLKSRLKGGSTNGNGQLLFPGQAERYRWFKWRHKSGNELRNFVRDQVFPYMGSLAKEEPQVAEYFRDAVLEIVDPNVLKQVIDEIDSIGFAKLGTDVKGDIFEYLLTHLGQAALNGQFRTPRQIRTMMVNMVDPDMDDTIYDPACGTGGFLIDAVEYILAKYSTEPQEIPIYGEEWLEKRKQTLEEAKKEIPTLQTYRKGPGEKIPEWGILEHSIYGIDVSRQLMRISMMNLVLHGIRKANVKRGNSLSDMGGLTEDDLNRRYKVILSNPPFAGVLPKESIRKDLPTNSKKSELLFLSVMMEALALGGRCAVVVPEGLLFNSTKAHIELRKKLIEDFTLHAVISLTDITDDGRLLKSGIVTLDLEDWESFRLIPGDLLFARSGNTVGKTYLYRKEDGICAYAGYLIRFKPDPAIVSPWYLFSLTQTGYYKSWVEARKRVAGQPNINGKEYSNLQIPCPPLPLQKQFTVMAESLVTSLDNRNDSKEQLDLLNKIILHRAFTGELTAKWREAHMNELLQEMELQSKKLNL
ncbi:MAG: N-6 DNA methylase [Desulfobacteraceae bacterium]|jgi:type I restriction enzyme M protein